MAEKRVFLDGNILWSGVTQAISRSQDPVLCIIRPSDVTFAAVSGLRLVVSWQFQLYEMLPVGAVFVIPPAIASFLTANAVRTRVELVIRGQAITLALQDDLGRYELRWKSDVASFPAPPEINHLLTVPDNLIEVSYLTISDAAHRAVAKLTTMESLGQIHRTKLAILVDFSHSRLAINGQEIQGGPKARYYFDPRLIIRALEFLKTDTIRVGVTPLLRGNHRGFFSIVTDQDGYRVHCALLSIGMETQKLYPLPPGRNQ